LLSYFGFALHQDFYHIKYNPPPADDKELLDRLIQREDDTEEKMRHRLEVYHNNIEAWLSVLRERHVNEYHFNGNRNLELVSKEVIQTLKNCSGQGLKCIGEAWYQFIINKLQCGSAMKPFC